MVLLAPAAAAAAPSASADRSCYFATVARRGEDLTDTIRLSGTGFAPAQPVRVTAGPETLPFRPGSATVTGLDGSLAVAVRSPRLRRGEARPTLVVSAGGAAAEVPVAVTDFAAEIAPRGARSSPRRRATVRLYGWLGVRSVYLHFVPPKARRALRTVRVAAPAGACGSARRTFRHLWPFRPRRSGAWRLQFDNARRYSPGNRYRVVYRSLVRLF